jgi:Zn-dependent peptidase ImmA (M78 family)
VTKLYSRRLLAAHALEAASAARWQAGLPAAAPVSPFDAAEKLGVTVRFVEINMEGMYRRARCPDIILSSLRPLARRTFTCAHELGHHILGHGSTIDELQNETEDGAIRPPEEFLADAFAGFFLMPPVGIRGALARRGIDPSRAEALDLYPVACAFGVGIEALVTQLSVGMAVITASRAAPLLKTRLAQVRRAILGYHSADPLVVVDDFCESQTIDVEVGSQIYVPKGMRLSGYCASDIRPIDAGGLVRAEQPGIGRLFSETRSWSAFLRVMKRDYIGLARYRHLEQMDE